MATPGRVFAVARSHTFAALADAIDTAFARWDRSRLCLCELADGGTRVRGPIPWGFLWRWPRGGVVAPYRRLSLAGF